ncbi:unnamed protein product [Caenorhabditis angaria]|uniref:Uncharacterized protein n=1 Tax=Caenorhabditis angaria TaxID=860376 RepID=A0A9P1MZA0_9PELO|nr:unnamed protein product [Caenorhabditis angaria]
MDVPITNEEQKKECPTFGVSLEEMNEKLKNYIDSIDPNEKYPENVNRLKPHHIRVIGAMGDSLTIGSRAQNNFEEFTQRYPGNTYFTGADFEIDKHLTIYNIFRYISSKTGSKLLPGSRGIDYGTNTMFNVAVSGMTCRDIPRQAEELYSRIANNSDVNIEEDWKMIVLWIGTNDVGTIGRREFKPITGEEYKSQIEKALKILKSKLPRTIVMIVGAFQPELLIEAEFIMRDGKRPRDKANQDHIDKISKDYQNAVFEIQNSREFNDEEFTVVVQPFATEYKHPLIDSSGNYRKEFYAVDEFHLSKLGHAVVAKYLWQNIFEPVGQKTTNASLEDWNPTIRQLTESNSLIKTIDNSDVD